jgi:fibronectin type 3 domain-containing protein
MSANATKRTLVSPTRPLHVECLEERLTPATAIVNYHGDLQSTGQNLTETILNPANVNTATFGKLYTTPIVGEAYAQPMYVPGVSVTVASATTTRDMVYVATMANNVYGVDASSGNIIWSRTFVNPSQGITTVPQTDVISEDITPQIGILSTPAVDVASNTMYVVARTKENRLGETHFVQTLHALDLSTGTSKFGGPKIIADTMFQNGVYTYVSGPSVAGVGDGSVGGRIFYNALRQNQRPALTLYNNTIYIASASHGDNGPYHGWILGYDATSLALKAAFNTTPNGGLGGIWMAGAGLTVDSQGFLYVTTGNGTFDSQLNAQGFPVNGNYGNSVLKLQVDPTSTPSNPNINGYGLKVVDYFTPFNQAQLSIIDDDLGSSGALILPDSVGSTANRRLLLTAGKEGRIYLINRDNMGKYSATQDNVVQSIVRGVNGLTSTPAYFNGSVYAVGAYGDQGKRFTIANAQITVPPTQQTTNSFLFPGSTPTVSANGLSNAIVWTLDRGSREVRAYRAESFITPIWRSNLAAGSRDEISGSIVKFTVPTVADGRVFVATTNSLVAYGLFSAVTSTPAAPTNLVARGVSSTQVRLVWNDNSNNESGFKIDYSVDGVNFTQVATAPANATEFFVGGLNPLVTYTFRVRATNIVGDSAYTNTATATTSGGSVPSGLDFSLGFALSASQLRYNGSAQIVGDALRLTSNSQQQTSSVFALDRRDIRQFTTQFTFRINRVANGGDGFTFAIQSVSPTVLGPTGGGLGYGAPIPSEPLGIRPSAAIKFDISWNAGEGFNSTGLYTNGASPTIPSTDLAGTGVELGNGNLLAATITYDGTDIAVQIRDTITGATAAQTYRNINLASILGANDAFIGFTGSTGETAAVQDILAWTYAPLTQPPSPQQLTATAGANSVQLAWQPVLDAQSYNIYRSTTSNTQGATPYRTGITTPNFTDTSLGNGQTYYYKVTALNAVSESARSTEAFATTPTFPLTPSDVVASSIQTTRLQIRWQLNSTNETGVRIIRRAGSDGLFQEIASLPPGTTFFADSGLTPGTTYNYRVIAFNNLGSADFAGVVTQTLPAGPATISANLVSATSAVLQWDPSFGATGYRVFRSTNSFDIDEDQTPFADNVTATSFTDNSITPRQRYYYRVQAINSSGGGPLSPVAAIEIPFSVGSFSQGVWRIDSNNNATVDPGDFTINFGQPGDVPLWGDWNRSGRDRLGVFRQGNWFLDTNGQTGWQAGDTSLNFGIASDVPTPGDWLGTGETELGVFRNGTWFLDTNGQTGWQGNDTILRFGAQGDIPVVGDWNGDGKDEIGTVRGTTWFLDTNGIPGWQGNDTVIRFGVGSPTDTPVVGDWNGDGRDEIGVYRTNGFWYLDSNGTPGWQSNDSALAYNISSAIPVVRRGLFSQPLRAETAISVTTSSRAVPSDSSLEAIVTTALGLWLGAGVSNNIAAVWRAGRISFADLPGDLLGIATNDRILLDNNAAGWRWFVDNTPSSNEEFVQGKGITKESSEGIDLLSVVLHELGHAFGWSDDFSNANEVMGDRLSAGTRRLPAGSVDAALSKSR